MKLLASLCEGGGPAGPEGENLATARNISDDRKALSPTRCGGSPLPEGAKGVHFLSPVYHIPSLAHSSQYCRISTKKPLLLSSDCQLHFVRLPRIIEA